ncbi:substrate-binding domain-containing protein [Arthrobacter globiformis]|nr:substrate-binding domain-containing protein [Arthrobacter globiformis]
MSKHQSRLALLAVTGLLITTGCSSGSGTTAGAGSPVAALDAATLGPSEIIGVGPDGDPAATIDDLALTPAEADKVRAGNFEVGLVMHTLNLDWSKLQIKGITDTFNKYGVKIKSTTAAEYKVDKQTSDLENTIQQKPDGIISIPVDNTAMAPAFKKVQAAGIKLVFMDNVPEGLKHPADYSSMISADSQGNGQIAAEILAAQIPKDGTVGIVDFGVDFFVTNQRTLGVTDWLAKNRPDIKVKKTTFTDTSKVSQTAGDFLTANPDVRGLFVVWDAPAMDTLSAMRAQGINIPVTTIDLGLESALELASGGPLKGLGAQRPYDQGVAEAMAMVNALIGKKPPAWVGVKSLAVMQSNLLEAYGEVWKTDPPQEVSDACEQAGNACR